MYVAITFPTVTTECLKAEIDDIKSPSPQDAKLDEHYGRLYRRIPRLWKSRYIQQLIHRWQQANVTTDVIPKIISILESKEEKEQKKISPSIITAPTTSFKLTSAQQACLNRLTYDVDETGWCYQQEKIAERWQSLLHALLIDDPVTTDELLTASSKLHEDKNGYPPVRCSFVKNGQIWHGHLRAGVVKQLLDDKKPALGQWRTKDKSIGGRHQVLRVVLPATANTLEQAMWFKLNPEQPGTEYLVQQIDQHLGSFATPAQQLCKITVGHQPPIPVLISQEVSPPTLNSQESQNLANVLKYAPEKLQKISPFSFCSTLLRVLILQPEDDKPNDYFLLPDPDNPGYYRLVRIDNERVFFSPEQIHENSWSTLRELNVKTIIFCLEQMQTSWDDLVKKDPRVLDYRQHIRRLVPAECLQDILREASDLHDQWCQLFLAEEVQYIAEAGLTQGGLCKALHNPP